MATRLRNTLGDVFSELPDGQRSSHHGRKTTAQLDDIRRQIESLKVERVVVEELESTVATLEGAIKDIDIYPDAESNDAGKPIDISRTTLEGMFAARSTQRDSRIGGRRGSRV
jgi:hypothetical protein